MSLPGRGWVAGNVLAGVAACGILALLHLQLARADAPENDPLPPQTHSNRSTDAFVKILPGGVIIRVVAVQGGIAPSAPNAPIEWPEKGSWWRPDGSLPERSGNVKFSPFRPQMPFQESHIIIHSGVATNTPLPPFVTAC
jgi:hypothetical protein